MSPLSKGPLSEANVLPHLPGALFSEEARAKLRLLPRAAQVEVEVHLENVFAALGQAAIETAVLSGEKGQRLRHHLSNHTLEYDVDPAAGVIWVHRIEGR